MVRKLALLESNALIDLCMLLISNLFLVKVFNSRIAAEMLTKGVNNSIKFKG